MKSTEKSKDAFVAKKEMKKAIDEEVNTLAVTTRSGFDRMDAKFIEMDAGFARMDNKFIEIDMKFEKIDKRFTEVDRRFDHVDKRFELVDKRFDRLGSLMTHVIEQLNTLRTEMNLRFSDIYHHLGKRAESHQKGRA